MTKADLLMLPPPEVIMALENPDPYYYAAENPVDAGELAKAGAEIGAMAMTRRDGRECGPGIGTAIGAGVGAGGRGQGSLRASGRNQGGGRETQKRKLSTRRIPTSWMPRGNCCMTNNKEIRLDESCRDCSNFEHTSESVGACRVESRPEQVMKQVNFISCRVLQAQGAR
jgi:hypothetical protein